MHTQEFFPSVVGWPRTTAEETRPRAGVRCPRGVSQAMEAHAHGDVLSGRLLHQRVRGSMHGHRKRARVCPRKTWCWRRTKLTTRRRMCRLHHHQSRFLRCASSVTRVCSQFEALRWIYGKHPPKRGFVFFFNASRFLGSTKTNRISSCTLKIY